MFRIIEFLRSLRYRWSRRYRDYEYDSSRGRRNPLLSVLLFPIVLLRRFVEWIGSLCLAIGRWLAETWEVGRLRHLIQGLPALVVVIGAILLGIAAQMKASDKIDDYRDAALEAYRVQDYATARLYFERLIELEGATDSTRYDLAITLEQLGHQDRATAMMHRLAPDDQFGFAQAHYWIAQKMLLKPSTYQQSDQLRVAHHHLMRAAEGMKDSPSVQLTVAQYYVAIGRIEEAIPWLEQAAKASPDLYFDLSLLYSKQGKEAQALLATQQADQYLKKEVSAHPDDDLLRLKWASVRTNLGDFEGSLAILRHGLALKPEGPYQSALAQAFILEYDRRLSKGNIQPGIQLALIRSALEYDVQSGPALVRLIQFVDGAGLEQKDARLMLEQMLASGQLPAVAHFALGVKAWEHEDLASAQWHLERAWKLDARLGDVANNLAWVLAHQEQPDYERALRIMNTLVENHPNVPTYLDTRGQILVKLGRHEEALDDLEKALSGLPNDLHLHKALAEVYRELKMDRLAEHHTTISTRLQEKMEKIEKE